MWGNQGRWRLHPGVATEKLQVDGGNTVDTGKVGEGRVEGPVCRHWGQHLSRHKDGGHGASTGWGLHRGSQVITSAFVQFLPWSHPPDKEVNGCFFLRNRSLESFSHFYFLLSKACLHHC